MVSFLFISLNYDFRVGLSTCGIHGYLVWNKKIRYVTVKSSLGPRFGLNPNVQFAVQGLPDKQTEEVWCPSSERYNLLY